ncbi:MAG: YbjN domain-containing protein [Rhodobiaceae bacterium]|nr:YbjN domain-containing protein [Rhodobiaceae bacterium]
MHIVSPEMQDQRVNPVDIVEHIADSNEWAFDRLAEDEISISVAGSWADYHISFTWRDDLEALHLACSFDLKVPETRRAEITKLLSLINEQLWLGHFDIWAQEGVVMYRHGVLLAGGGRLNEEQCEGLMRAATEACERYYQAFQFVVWAGKSAMDALETVVFETAGTA